eukprot:scaffold12676_cov112-Isochrysis_galbana.AAC.9
MDGGPHRLVFRRRPCLFPNSFHMCAVQAVSPVARPGCRVLVAVTTMTDDGLTGTHGDMYCTVERSVFWQRLREE